MLSNADCSMRTQRRCSAYRVASSGPLLFRGFRVTADLTWSVRADARALWQRLGEPSPFEVWQSVRFSVAVS
jgi:hypothetical protein